PKHSNMAFDRLVRFEDDEGKIHYGNVPYEFPSEGIDGAKIQILKGDISSGFSKGDGTATVKKLLCPLETTPIVPCIGLNYGQHAKEADLPIAKYPVVFTKPADALTGPYDDVFVHVDAQSQLDYEGELTVVIGKDGKNIPEDKALEYVLGYTVGNDVSARNFQLPPNSGGQFGYAKSFDGFAPIGPCVVSTSIIPDPQKLDYVTKVNGKIRQETSTSDMIWNIKQIIAHLSRGTTLRKGTAIMTGTPSGVGLFHKDGFLNDGDVVEVSVTGIGAIKNRMVYEK
ncbi:Uncharacterized protein LAWI1_G006943, partial [Lachnellula willkommii]